MKKQSELVAQLKLPEGKSARLRKGQIVIVSVSPKKEKKLTEEELSRIDAERRNAEHLASLARYKAEKAASEAELMARYKAAIANPPALIGSEKQVAWANSLRAAFVKFYGQTRPKMVGRDLVEKTHAAQWIDCRFGLGVTNSDQRAINRLIKS